MIRKFLANRRLSIPIILLLLSLAYLILTASGPIRFIGFNSNSEGGISIEEPEDVYGSTVNMHVYGDTLFSGTDYYKTVTVNGMPPDAMVNISWKDGAAVAAGDAVVAVEVDEEGGQFTVYRSTNTAIVTPNLEFYWDAYWEKED